MRTAGHYLFPQVPYAFEDEQPPRTLYRYTAPRGAPALGHLHDGDRSSNTRGTTQDRGLHLEFLQAIKRVDRLARRPVLGSAETAARISN